MKFDLQPDDTIRVLVPWKLPKRTRYVDGARLADLPRRGVVHLLRTGRIEVRRGRKIVRPRGWKPPLGGKIDPWANQGDYHGAEQPPPQPVERPCISCGRKMLSEGPHHRMCGLCRHD